MNELWTNFTKSGRVEDYLRYKQQEARELKNADNSQGLDNKRTDYRGE